MIEWRKLTPGMLAVVLASSITGCWKDNAGGACVFDSASVVTIAPSEDCLTMTVLNPDSEGGCGVPDLKVANACSASVVVAKVSPLLPDGSEYAPLPPSGEAPTGITIAPGTSGAFELEGSVHAGSTDYHVPASLGSTPITISFTFSFSTTPPSN